jgi:hypothetical protein
MRMTRRQRDPEWVHHRGDHGETANPDLTPALHHICTDDGGLQTAQDIRVELVDGMRREAMLGRIRERLGEESRPEHIRYTRRSWLELQGRRHAWRPRLAAERN